MLKNRMRLRLAVAALRKVIKYIETDEYFPSRGKREVIHLLMELADELEAPSR